MAAAYYTQGDYEARFGQDELVRLTDATGAGQVDVAAFAQAVADASADIDAYLAARYDLPLSDPAPRVVKSIAAALVREKLHGVFPTETVTLEADRARRQLRDLSTGTARLTLDATGDEATEQRSGLSGIKVSAPARTFTQEQLAKF